MPEHIRVVLHFQMRDATRDHVHDLRITSPRVSGVWSGPGATPVFGP